MTLEQSLRMAMVNGRGEARKQAGMSYTKMAYKPRTIAEAADLALNHKKYGLSSDEYCELAKIMNNK
jgi:hypothetical protein